MSELIVITALLGIFWIQFDRLDHRYQAEGNGAQLSGSYDPQVGICFSFQQFNRSDYGPRDSHSFLDWHRGASGGLPSLRMATDVETRETLLSLGMLRHYAHYLTDAKKKPRTYSRYILGLLVCFREYFAFQIASTTTCQILRINAGSALLFAFQISLRGTMLSCAAR